MKATLIRTELSSTGSSTQEIAVVSALAEDTLFVDYDTDKDGVGNSEDTDDDNDTFTDAIEKQNGTDPLIKNEVIVQNETPKEKQEETDLEKNEEEPVRKQTTDGLEQYLAPSRAETVLSTVTEYVDTAKQKVDTYREVRKVADETLSEAESSNVQVQTNEDGFGEITRNDADGTRINAGGFLDNAFTLISRLFNNIYTFVLWTISFVLGHPILVQLAILLGILFTILRLASKFGNRRNRY
jgi:predicted DNA-binding protein (UPF0251 family)